MTRRVLPPAVAAAAILTAAATPAQATEADACGSIIFNACFYPEKAFHGTEYRTTIYYPGCFRLPPSRSYHTDVVVKVYSESDCTGQSTEIRGYFGFDIGFDARSYFKSPG
ncbi:hypothetical protein [Amycolatopsis sp. NPDC058986]|uniref:hypothetical protein n=1 Tax=unclassified Amycolatopsis TaxID=2618356 RepID=UPI00366D0345